MNLLILLLLTNVHKLAITVRFSFILIYLQLNFCPVMVLYFYCRWHCKNNKASLTTWGVCFLNGSCAKITEKFKQPRLQLLKFGQLERGSYLVRWITCDFLITLSRKQKKITMKGCIKKSVVTVAKNSKKGNILLWICKVMFLAWSYAILLTYLKISIKAKFIFS